MTSNSNIYKFVTSIHSSKPSLIIQETSDLFLVTIDEYSGDYKFINKDLCKFAYFSPEKELSLISNYGNWFYNDNSNIFQELIIKNLYHYFKQ